MLKFCDGRCLRVACRSACGACYCACRRLRVYMLLATLLAEKVGVYLLPVALLAESGCLHVVCYSGRRRVDVYMLLVALLAGG